MQIRLAMLAGALALGVLSVAVAKINQAIKRRTEREEQLKRDLERWDTDGWMPRPAPNTGSPPQNNAG